MEDRIAVTKRLYLWLHFEIYERQGIDLSEYDALSIFFDNYTMNQKMGLESILRTCERAYKQYHAAMSTANTELNRVNGMDRNNVPERVCALQQLTSQYVVFESMAERLLKELDMIKRAHMNFQRNVWAARSIHLLYQRIHGEIRHARSNRREIEKEVTEAAQAKEAVDPAAEKKARLKKAREDMEGGELDYVAPKLSSTESWVFAKSLGGDMAVASLWVRLDENGIVRDRIVRKDTKWSNDSWRNSRNWYVNPDDPTQKIPMEHHCHNLTQGTREAPRPHIVQMRKCEVDVAKTLYRLYTNFCPYGDLSNLIEANNMQLAKLPEAWVWMVFSALVDAGLAMEQVNGYNNTVQVVHRDLKPMNIFLDLEAEDKWPRYPQVRVGDFGLAIVTSPLDDGNPLRWGMAGTKNFFAPEQTLLGVHPRPKGIPMMLAWTNVWGIGRIMLDIVNQTASFQARAPQYNAWNKQCDQASFKEGVSGQYSGVLLNTILACLAHSVMQRPSFAQLRAHIDTLGASMPEDTQSWSDKLNAYVHNGRKGIQLEDPQWDLHGLPTEQYKVHMAFQNIQSSETSGTDSAAVGASSSRRWTSP